MSENWKPAAGGLLLIMFFFASAISAQKIGRDNTAEGAKEEAAVAAADDTKSDSENSTPSTEKKKSSKDDSTEEKDKNSALPPASWKLRRGEKEWVLEAASSPFNPSNFTGPKEYDVYGRDLHLTNFRWGRVIGTKGAITFQYLFGATPLTVFTKNEVANPDFVSAKKTPAVPPTLRQMSWGFAVQPANFRFIFFPKSRIKPFAQVGAGILITNKAVPVPRSTMFQFTGDFGGGVQFFTSREKAINFSYRYFHISNGNINGHINNPGYNANIFSVSYSLFSR